ncbi:MAG TPA: acyltransferase [Ktedonobacteraceae bacterium]|jgi:peptidoglycan/LPS O-acetylase OafA/YrhL
MRYSIQNIYQSFYSRLKRGQSITQQEGQSTIATLDGVRAIAALFVIGFHIDAINKTDLWVPWQHPFASALITFGGSGVTLFFVLSGFLLFMPYAKALLFAAKWPSARQFYVRRALRILPGYYTALILIIVLFQHQYLQSAYWKRLLLFVTMLMDSSPQTFRQLDGPFWTLAIEWQFYMLMPLIMFGFYWIVRKLQGSPQRRLFNVLGCCFGLITYGLLIRYIGIYCAQHPDQTFHLPVVVRNVAVFFLYGMTGKYLENFAMGMIICTCYVYAQHPEFGVQLKEGLLRNSRWLRRLGLVLLLFTAIWHFQVLQMPVAQFHFLDPLKSNFDWLNEMVIATGYSSWILAILFGSRSLTSVFSFLPLRKIGTISFGLYMWHLPLLDLFRDKILPHLDLGGPRHVYFAYWVWVFICVFPVAIASYVLVERPWLKLRARVRNKQEVPVGQTKAAQ